MPERIQCVGYTRVSTERQAGEERSSLKDQATAVRELAERLGLEVGLWFQDAGASGATVAGRTAFRELLQWCEAHSRPTEDPGHVLALNDSRFGRFPDPDEAAALRFRFKGAGWIVRFAEGDDIDGTLRSVVRSLGAAQASEYRENLVRNTRRGMKGAAVQGFWTREAPFGFRRVVAVPAAGARMLEIGQLKAPNEKVRLAPHAEESDIVREAFRTYGAGNAALREIATMLRSQVPGRRWSVTVVAAMLRNDAYRGAVVGGRRRDGGAELYGCEDAHPAIVTPAEWSAVQARLATNAERGRGARTHYLLSGLMACVYCGQAFTGGGGGRSRTKDPARTHRRFYRDSGGMTGVCPGRIGTVMRHLVDDAVLKLIGDAVSSPSVRRRMSEALDSVLDRASGAPADAEASARAAAARWELRRDRLVAAIAAGTVLPEEAESELERIRMAIAQLKATLHQLRFAKGRARGVASERDRLLDIAADFPGLASRLEGPALRSLVEPWIGTATFDKIERTLSLGIRPVPATPSLVLYSSRERGEHDEVDLIIRTKRVGPRARAVGATSLSRRTA